MHLILTGATGLVGSACLQHMLATPSITKVSILSRRPVPMAEGKSHVNVIIHKDFNNYPPEVLEQLKGAHGCVWAQGISYQDVDHVEYEKITVQYPLAAAKAFASSSSPLNFVYVSGEGATETPGMLTMAFGKVKGVAEASLLELSKATPGLNVYSARPAMVDFTLDPELQPWIPKRFSEAFHYRVALKLAPVLRAVMSSHISPTKDLGRVLVELAMGDGNPLEGTGILGEGRTIANVGIRRIAGL